MKERKRLTLKQEAWVKKTADTLNPTQAALQTYETKSYNTAGQIATENLNKPQLKERLLQVMAEKGIDNSFLLTKHKENVSQNKNLPARNTALDMFYRILGSYAPEETRNFNLNLNLDDPRVVEDRVNQLQDELRQLSEGVRE